VIGRALACGRERKRSELHSFFCAAAALVFCSSWQTLRRTCGEVDVVVTEICCGKRDEMRLPALAATALYFDEVGVNGKARAHCFPHRDELGRAQ
jgi:hypothetical protein